MAVWAVLALSSAHAQPAEPWGRFGYGSGNIKGGDFDVEILRSVGPDGRIVWTLARTTHRLRIEAGSAVPNDIRDWIDGRSCPALDARLSGLAKMDWRAIHIRIQDETPYLDAGGVYLEAPPVAEQLRTPQLVDQDMGGPLDQWVKETLATVRGCWSEMRPKP
jgi:hypothetical protein